MGPKVTVDGHGTISVTLGFDPRTVQPVTVTEPTALPRPKCIHSLYTITDLCSVTDVLGNLTALKVLDLSHNELTELPGALFGTPRNLTAIYLQNNLLTVLPLAELVSLRPQLRIVDVRANRLQHFHDELMPLIENGTRVLYAGKHQERYSLRSSFIVNKIVPVQAVKARRERRNSSGHSIDGAL